MKYYARLCWCLCLLLVFSSVARAVPVRGTLLGPDDKPVANAEIWVQNSFYSLLVRGDVGPPRLLKSDNNGQFALEIEKSAVQFPGNVGDELDASQLAVARIKAPGFAL